MRNLFLLLHVVAAIVWLGGMTFALFALRPAAHSLLQPPVRLPLMVQVLRRFFPLVIAAIVVLLPTGVWLLMQMRGAQAPAGWHAMAGLGVVMALVFGHLFFAPWRRLQRAVAAQDWPEGGRRMNQVVLLVQVNLALGWLAVIAVFLWR
ncbi:MAG: hypothetical protein EOO29_26695 [Comamonadaceae bacterium]|nr:MAG: hypothetical protein EOO29_26695 [Comamonadaceae bacterium]